MDETKGPLSGLPPTDPQGPRRKAPAYYIGETVGKRYAMPPDVERLPNGKVRAVHDKAARRIIRKAFLRSHSSVEKRIRFARAMKAQALEVARDEKKSTRWGMRLLARELAIHQPVYAPDKKTLRVMRTEARRRNRRGAAHVQPINNAIDQVVTKYGGDKVFK